MSTVNPLKGFFILCALAGVIVFGFIVALSWYMSGVQAEVYRRQGVAMTQWEVFIGVKPIVRGIVEEKAP